MTDSDRGPVFQQIVNEDKYRPTPFWFLNHELERDELVRQIGKMKESKVAGFFMHPRAGLQIPYGSRHWFETIRFIVEEAERNGLKAWLYDDDPFPSGIAGSKVIFEHPEYRAHSLLLRKFKPDADGRVFGQLGIGKILSVVAVKSSQDGISEIVDLKDEVGILRERYFKCEWDSPYYATMLGTFKFDHHRAETFYPEQVLKCTLEGSDWEVIAATAEILPDSDKHGYRSDNLNPESVRCFIENTHEKYLKHCGDYFGSAIPGIFTDEPAVGGSLPWTEILEKTFQELKGYELAPNYFHLAADFGEKSAKVREDYWEVVNRLYADSYFKQIHEWCQKHGLLCTGHIICEEDPIGQVHSGGNMYAYQKYMDIPGFDIVTTNIGDSRFPVLSFGGKLISSAAHQQGKRKIQSECFGCAPWNFGKESMLKTSGWLFALGITWLVPHGFFYSIDGFRKYDAGKAYSFQDPCYDDFPWFADYSARMGAVLGEADHLSRTAVLYQISSFWQVMPAREDKAEELRGRLYSVTQALIGNHIEFDFVDEDTVLDSRIQDGQLTCGDETYTSVVIPFPESMGAKGRECIQKLRDSGVKIIEVDVKDQYIAEVMKSGAIHTQIEPMDDESLSSDLMVLRKRLADDEIIYIFNNSAAPGRFRLNAGEDRPAYIYDAGADKYLTIQAKDDWLEFGLNGYQSLLFVLPTSALQTDCEYIMPETLESAVLPAESDPQWHYPMPDGGECTIYEWDIEVEGRGLNKKISDQPYCLLRDILGTELQHLAKNAARPYPDLAPVVPSVYPVKTQFTADFDIKSDDLKHLLLFENDTFAGNAIVTLNGRELSLSDARRETIYDPLNLVLDVQGLINKGRNTITIRFPEATEFDGLKSALYII